jgi:hypothetical protein
MADELRTLADRVQDEASFVRFVEALGSDWEHEQREEAKAPSSPYGPGANGWENGTIGQFLEGATAWAKASRGGLEFYEPPVNPWRRCAHILLAGKSYE